MFSVFIQESGIHKRLSRHACGRHSATQLTKQITQAVSVGKWSHVAVVGPFGCYLNLMAIFSLYNGR